MNNNKELFDPIFKETYSENNSYIPNGVFEVITETLKEQTLNLIEETSLVELGINSINYISIIVALENRFDMEFEDDMLGIKSFENIKQIIEYIKKLKMNQEINTVDNSSNR
jgi:acyl carrier protein